jgi:hypothetical protein
MSFGRLVTPPNPWPLSAGSPLSAQFGSATLYAVALQWFVSLVLASRPLANIFQGSKKIVNIGAN